ARTLQFAPLTSEGAFREIFCTLACGGTLVLSEDAQRSDLASLLAHLRAAHIERAFLPAPVVEMLASVVARRRDTLPQALIDVVTDGEQLQFTAALRALFGALHDCVLHIQYGPTRAKPVLGRELVAQPTPAPWPVPLPQELPQADSAGGAPASS